MGGILGERGACARGIWGRSRWGVPLLFSWRRQTEATRIAADAALAQANHHSEF